MKKIIILGTALLILSAIVPAILYKTNPELFFSYEEPRPQPQPYVTEIAELCSPKSSNAKSFNSPIDLERCNPCEVRTYSHALGEIRFITFGHEDGRCVIQTYESLEGSSTFSACRPVISSEPLILAVDPLGNGYGPSITKEVRERCRGN